MPITIGSSIVSLGAQRRLGRVTDELALISERLSTGQRINRASDDAAGLAISSSLDADSRIYAQAIRNANDGVSLLNIADGALTQLSDIVIRIKELAEQAANGVYSNEQRNGLDAEAQKLREEYARILATTEFNGTGLIDRSKVISLQLGKNSYSEDGQNAGALDVNLGGSLNGGSIGTREFTYSGGTTLAEFSYNPTTGDFNGDGLTDMLLAGSTEAHVYLGNGDGTFKDSIASGGVSYFGISATGDFNNDGNLDFVSPESGSGDVRVSFGNGDGTFSTSGVVFTASAGNVNAADVDNNGLIDLLINEGNYISVMLNNGDGTFSEKSTFTNGGTGSELLQLADFNGDGNVDLLGVGRIHFGDGTGNFVGESITGSSWESRIGDFDNDGDIDFLRPDSGQSELEIYTNDGKGVFSFTGNAPVDIGPNSVVVGDIDGDGNLDAIYGNSGQVTSLQVAYGNGTGSFTTSEVISSNINTGRPPALGDFNEDGVLDVAIMATGTQFSVFLQGSESTAALTEFSLQTRGDALNALGKMDIAILGIAQERAGIGANLSRLSSALSNLQSSRENSIAARSQILDADIASESSALLRNQILQQTAAAVLSQANQAPALALQLLG